MESLNIESLEQNFSNEIHQLNKSQFFINKGYTVPEKTFSINLGNK
jgi:hypothetical protein